MECTFLAACASCTARVRIVGSKACTKSSRAGLVRESPLVGDADSRRAWLSPVADVVTLAGKYESQAVASARTGPNAFSFCSSQEVGASINVPGHCDVLGALLQQWAHIDVQSTERSRRPPTTLPLSASRLD